MEKRNQDLRKYEQWCVENEKDPLNEANVKEYQMFLAEQAKEKKGQADVAKINKALKAICVALEIDYEPNCEGYEKDVENALLSIVYACKMMEVHKKVSEIYDEFVGK